MQPTRGPVKWTAGRLASKRVQRRTRSRPTSRIVLRAVLDELANQLELRHLNVRVNVDGVRQLSEVHRVHRVTDWHTHTHTQSSIFTFYTVGNKTGANLFLSVTSSKINGFRCSFLAVRFWNERYLWMHELLPPHLINGATQPCESRKNENACAQNFSF